MKECLKCNGAFEPPNEKSKFCCLTCANQYNGEKAKKYTEINCKQCDQLVRGRSKSMYKRKFCDSACAAKFNNQWIPKRLPEGECDDCGEPCRKSRKYCSSECQIKAKGKRYSKRHRVKASKYVRDYRKRQKQLAVDYKSGCCRHCGYNKCLSALQFHHLDPSKKDFNIGSWLGKQKSFDQMKVELDKCVLLCSNCHAEEHERLLLEKHT